MPSRAQTEETPPVPTEQGHSAFCAGSVASAIPQLYHFGETQVGVAKTDASSPIHNCIQILLLLTFGKTQC